MKRLLITLALLLALAGGAVAALPLLISSDWIRDRIVAELERSTGLTLSLDGPVSLGLWPSLALEADDVGLAWGEAPDFALVREVRVGLAVGPLLQGRIALTGLDLIGPEINLLVDADGRRNWVAAPAGADPSAAAGAEGPVPGAETSAASGGAIAVSIAAVRLTEGRLTYADERSDAFEVAEAIAIDTALSDLAAPVRATGGFTLRGAPVTLDLTLNTPAALRDGRPVGLAGHLETAFAKVAVDGNLDPAAARFEGRASLESGDVPALARLFGAGEAPVRQVSLDGALTADARRVEATGLRILADDVAGSGEIALDLSGERPRVDARLALEAVDLDRLGRSAPPAGTADRDTAAAAPASAEPKPFAFPAIDGGIDLSIAEISGSALAVTGPLRKARVVAVLDKGILTTVVGPLKLLRGTADFRATLKPDARGLRLDGTLKAKGFDVNALAALAGARPPLGGDVSADLAFAAVGRSAADFRQTLGAAGTLGMTQGNLDGLGLGKVFGDPLADRLAGMEIKLAIASLDEPVRITGSALFRRQPLVLDVTVDPRRALSGSAFPLKGTINSKRMAFSFEGILDPKTRAITGGVGIDAASLDAAMAVIGRPVDGLPPGKVAIFGHLDASPQRIVFGKADFTLADTHLAGDVEVDLTPARPKLVARLKGETVDLGALIGGASGAGAPTDRSAAAGPSGPSGWSDATFDLSGLRTFDADVGIGAGRVVFAGTETGAARVALVNEAGLMTVTLPEFAVYGGKGSADIAVDARKTTTIAAKLQLADADALPLLAGATGFRRIEGRLDAAIDVTTAGSSMRGFVENLGGTARLEARDGALRGIDLDRLLRAAAVAIVSGVGEDAKAKTTFHTLSATFRIDRGQVVNDDLALQGPLVRASGQGRIDLPGRTLGYRVVPVLVAPGRDDLTFDVPLVVEGPWQALRIYPDIQGILQDPVAAYERLRKLGGAFGQLGGEAGNADLGAVVEEIAPQLGLPAAAADPLGALLNDALGRKPKPEKPQAGDAAPLQPEKEKEKEKKEKKAAKPKPENAGEAADQPPTSEPAQEKKKKPKQTAETAPRDETPEEKPKKPKKPAPDPVDPVEQLIRKGLGELLN